MGSRSQTGGYDAINFLQHKAAWLKRIIKRKQKDLRKVQGQIHKLAAERKK